MAIEQSKLFLIFILAGICIGVVFDVFRIFRKTFKTHDFITYIEDILFWILTGLIMLYVIYNFGNGQIRFYMFLGAILGCLLYMLIFSKYFININVIILSFIKKIFVCIFSFFKKFFEIFFSKIFLFFAKFVKIKRIFSKKVEK